MKSIGSKQATRRTRAAGELSQNIPAVRAKRCVTERLSIDEYGTRGDNARGDWLIETKAPRAEWTFTDERFWKGMYENN